jgi:hypothetical protein
MIHIPAQPIRVSANRADLLLVGAAQDPDDKHFEIAMLLRPRGEKGHTGQTVTLTLAEAKTLRDAIDGCLKHLAAVNTNSN